MASTQNKSAIMQVRENSKDSDLFSHDRNHEIIRNNVCLRLSIEIAKCMETHENLCETKIFKNKIRGESKEKAAGNYGVL